MKLKFSNTGFTTKQLYCVPAFVFRGMKRTALRLGELEKGDMFYFAEDKKREMYRCLGEGEPEVGFNYTRHNMNIQPSSEKNRKLGFPVSISANVVKVEF